MFQGVNEKKISVFDLNAEKVVEEWEANGTRDIMHYTGETKNSQVDNESTFYACTSKGIMLMDPRVSGQKKAVMDKSKNYSKDMLFNKIASTNSGNYLVTSTNGELRMYTKMGQNAKTLLPGIGQKIIGVDTSHKGDWVLATCPQVILVIPTLRSDGKTGFEKKMGKEKPAPRKLNLRN